MPQGIPTPLVDERFIYSPKFGRIRVRMLNADGHIDIAHKMGLISLKTTLIESKTVETTQMNDDGEAFVSQTRWATVLVTAKVLAPDGVSIIECDGISCVNDRDKFVKSPGLEIAVAETRAIKRALGSACNITEKYINPKGQAPTRETVDMPLGKDVDDEDDDDTPGMPAGLPQDVIRKPNISPAIGNITQRKPSTEQFDI